jgi:Yip1 domain
VQLKRRNDRPLIATRRHATLAASAAIREAAMEHLVRRVQAILLSPDTEWPVIEREPGDVAFLFSRYVAILAAIPALARFIGGTLVGGHLTFLAGLLSAIAGYLMTFVVVYVVALIIDALAPSFGAQKNFPNALKLSVYSHTPFWLAGIFFLMPGLSFLTVLGLYGLYLLYLGLPVLVRAPREQALLYAAAVVLCALILAIVVGALQVALFFSAVR